MQIFFAIENANLFPFGKEVLVRVLGLSKGESDKMTQWVLKSNSEIMTRKTLRHLQFAELHLLTELKKRELFDVLVKKRCGRL